MKNNEIYRNIYMNTLSFILTPICKNIVYRTRYHRRNKYDETKCQFYIDYISCYNTDETILSGPHISCFLNGDHFAIVSEAYNQGAIDTTACWEYGNERIGICEEPTLTCTFNVT